jgi:hypothetical protein
MGVSDNRRGKKLLRIPPNIDGDIIAETCMVSQIYKFQFILRKCPTIRYHSRTILEAFTGGLCLSYSPEIVVIWAFLEPQEIVPQIPKARK